MLVISRAGTNAEPLDEKGNAPQAKPKGDVAIHLGFFVDSRSRQISC
jgi:hypothetical protein